ncbi:MAG: HAMP domain-containing protein, partial [Defluviitaleaceae bacterium]|nr:HAMP domain-containing protein [Defluviitaleaceae bacterium]
MERQRREPKFFKWIGYVLSTLRFKLFLSYILISILPLFILWAIVSVTVDNHILELRLSEQRSMTSQTAITLREINYFDNLVMRSLHDVSLDRDARAFSARIFVADSDGVVVHDSDGAPGTLLTHPTILSALDGEISYSVTEGSDTLIQTAAPITDGYGSIVGAVMLVHTMVDAGGIIAGITDQILLLIAAIAATVALLVFLIASWLLNPLKNVSAAVKKVSEGHLNQRVWLEGRGEIYELGVAFNNMAHRL